MKPHGRREEFDPNAKDVEYESPQVEEVMSADDLAREVHYAAGAPFSDPFETTPGG